ncbi:MAG: DUF5706 domain-containing protein [Saprospiraceae bacterium]|nr:DUF5706 domain-containing protein [Saprospiraceae bacterium]
MYYIKNEKKKNKLIGQCFTHMGMDEYTQSVMSVVEDGKTLYSSILTDIHNVGVTLARKYRLIRNSYLIFLYGVIISVILFAICHLVY